MVKSSEICAVDGCELVVNSLGMCSRHYYWLSRYSSLSGIYSMRGTNKIVGLPDESGLGVALRDRYGKLVAIAEFDPFDLERVAKFKWWYDKAANCAVTGWAPSSTMQQYFLKCMDKHAVWNKDGNTLNNRRNNICFWRDLPDGCISE